VASINTEKSKNLMFGERKSREGKQKHKNPNMEGGKLYKKGGL